MYKPFGIINLEAMACETPVVASAVGGIPEVVEHGETGLLVAPEAISATDVEPRHPDQFSRDLAAAVNTLLDDPALRDRMAAQARARVEQKFSWTSIARQTLEFYEELVGPTARGDETGEGVDRCWRGTKGPRCEVGKQVPRSQRATLVARHDRR